MDYQKVTVDYLEGRISPAEFEEMVETDDALYAWFQNIVPSKMTCCVYDPVTWKQKSVPYDIRIVFKNHERLDHGGPKGSVAYHYYLQLEIAKLIRGAFPDLVFVMDKRLQRMNALRFDCCPSYIGGAEVAKYNILGELIESIPLEWSITKQKKVLKNRIKEAFHITGREYPHWIQSPEWPVSNGKPMKYIKTTKVNPEYVQHHFVDTDSKEERIVDDFY